MAILEQLPSLEDELGEDEAEPIAPEAVATAELAECTCPEFCERDHGNE
jgi:hypothetical protein